MAFPTRIYLTGFMGSGKSTIGSILANVLGYAFLDLDHVIAARVGKSVPRIFAEEGEAVFRALEADCLRRTATNRQVVVAVGGGALTVEKNLQWALAHGTVVYLHVPLDQLVQRLLRGRTVRPLLLDEEGQVLPYAILREKIKGLMDRREPFYQRAHLVVETGRERVGLTVDTVVYALKKYSRGQRP
ncbi:MAG: shikimate kinase [Rhodothermales bacterium]